MRLRLGFSIVASLDFDILLLDEVLAVGDAVFQNKCFERLMDFKRAGKTLVITTQSMESIERLCNKAVLLDHGRLLFQGEPGECVARYRTVSHSEKFYVGPTRKNLSVYTSTKRWVEESSSWGYKLGTKEMLIDSVILRNKFGSQTNQIKSGDALSVRVNFTVRDAIREPHFGIAILREDGVYCYGPNTRFDGYFIPELNKGEGWFELLYNKVCLAPGTYKLSVALWDRMRPSLMIITKDFIRLSSREILLGLCKFLIRLKARNIYDGFYCLGGE